MGRWLAVAFAYLAVVGVAGAVIGTAIDRLATVWLAPHDIGPAIKVVAPATPAGSGTKSVERAPPTFVTVRQASMIPTTDDWADKLRDPAFWAKLKNGKGGSSKASSDGAKSGLGGPWWNSDTDPAKPVAPPTLDTENWGDTYRTVCVRLCDGAFFPISYSTTRDNFDADAAKCERTCTGGRLYTYRNPGSDLAEMEDLEGRPYDRLATAFLFRTTYNEQCRCRPHPWEEAARDQHRVYALETQRKLGDGTGTAELAVLSAKIKKADAETAASIKRSNLVVHKRSSEASKADVRASTGDRRRGASAGKPTSIKASASSGAAELAATGRSSGRKTARR